MKTIILSVIFSSLFLFNSCTKEDNLLDDNSAREAFIGAWTANDGCTKLTYGVDIKEDPDNSSQVLIINFANIGRTASAVIAGNSIYIDSQEVGGGYTVSGNGKLNGVIISWSNYRYENDVESSECTATYSNKHKL